MTEQIPEPTAGTSSPTPPPPPPPPPSAAESGKPRRTRWFVVGGIVLALLIATAATGVVGRSSASTAAKDYDKAIAAWNKKELPKLIDTATAQPDALFPSGDVTSEKSIDSQKELCGQMSDARDDVTDSYSLPTLDDNVFGFLSGAYGDTKDEAAKWSATVEKFHDQATEHLTTTVADCTLQIAYHEKRAAADKAWDETRKYLDKYQQSQVIGDTRWTCNHKDGCRPVASEKFTSYVKAYRAYVEAESAIGDALTGDGCATSSLGKDGCSAVAALYHDHAAANSEWLDMVENAGPTGHEKVEDKLSAANDRTDKEWDDGWAAFTAWAVKAYPDLEDDSGFDLKNLGVTQVLWFAGDLRRTALEDDAPEAN